MTQAVLAGIRVLDFGRYVAGPFCAALLGYLGAEVIRIEKPDGSEDRFIHPLSVDDAGEPGDGALLYHSNCNKRSICIDLGNPQAREVVDRLVASADMVVANLPDAALRKLGLDYESLKKIRPDIILLTQDSFGNVGPDAGRPGFDGVGQAMSGAMAMTGLPGAPAKAAAPYVDYATAVLSAFGALAALRHRDLTGQGQQVETALLRTALSVFGAFLTEEAVLGLGRVPSGNRVQTSGPSDCFATADGHVLIHVVGNGLFRRIARMVGKPEWIDDPRFQSDDARGNAGDEICSVVASWCAARTTAQALVALTQAGVPSGPVLSPAQALANPHVQAAGWLRDMARPGAGVPVPTVDLPVSFSALQAGLHSAPPRPGEHSCAILQELDFSDQEVAALLAAGAVQSPSV